MNLLSVNYSSLILSILALLFAVGGTVLMFIFIVPEKKREKLNPFGKLIHDTFNFKYLIIEKIMQALYIFITFYVILAGFFAMFSSFLRGLVIMLLGPILVRLAYEGIMMAILLVKNVIQINNKLRTPEDGGAQTKDIFSVPVMEAPVVPETAAPVVPEAVAPVMPETAAPVAPEAPVVRHFCNNCGAKVSENALFCPECGKKL